MTDKIGVIRKLPTGVHNTHPLADLLRKKWSHASRGWYRSQLQLNSQNGAAYHESFRQPNGSDLEPSITPTPSPLAVILPVH